MSDREKVDAIFDRINKKYEEAKENNKIVEAAEKRAAEGISDKEKKAGEIVLEYNENTARVQEDLGRVRERLNKGNVILVDEAIEERLVDKEQVEEKPIRKTELKISKPERELV